MSAARVVLLLVSLVVASCIVEPPPERAPDFELQSERLVVLGYDRSEDQLCAGTLEWMDGYIDALAPYYELEPGVIGEYRWYSKDLLLELDPCGGGAACVRFPRGSATITHTSVVPHEHELAHMLNVHCIAILSEGLAEFLRGTQPAKGELGDVPFQHTVDASFEPLSGSSGDYHNARHFVSFLAHEYGLSSVIDLCAAAPTGISIEEFDAATQDILDASFGSLLLAYEDYPKCPEEQDRAKIFECSREPDFVVGPGQDQDIDIEVGCDQPNAVGSRDGVFGLSYSVRLLEDATYGFTFYGDVGVDMTGTRYRLEQCASCGEGAKTYMFEPNNDYVSLPDEYPAGDYTLELRFPGEFVGRVHIQLIHMW